MLRARAPADAVLESKTQGESSWRSLPACLLGPSREYLFTLRANFRLKPRPRAFFSLRLASLQLFLWRYRSVPSSHWIPPSSPSVVASWTPRSALPAFIRRRALLRSSGSAPRTGTARDRSSGPRRWGARPNCCTARSPLEAIGTSTAWRSSQTTRGRAWALSSWRPSPIWRRRTTCRFTWRLAPRIPVTT